MTSGGTNAIGQEAAKEIVALREKWHTKNHPFFIEFSEGKFGLEPMGRMMAQHYHHVKRVLPALGVAYYRSPPGAREFMLENLLEEEGMMAGPGEDREAQDHMELIFRFCKAAGMSEEEVLNTEVLPAWRARSNFYVATVHDEPIPVVLAMQSSQEGQQPAINAERTLPAFKAFHGFTSDSPEIGFFAEHEVADADHSRRQIDLVAELVTTPELKQRALDVVGIAVKTRWACMTDVYRTSVLGEQDPLPTGV